jgi:hypothetical protein
MAGAERITELTAQALDEFESTSSVSALVRRAHRIAMLRHDYAGQVWLALQLRDWSSSVKPDGGELYALYAKLIALLGASAGRQEYEKQVTKWEASHEMLDPEGQIHGASVDQIETRVTLVEQNYAQINTARDSPTEDPDSLSEDWSKSQAHLLPMISSLRNILSKIRVEVHNYLVATEAELEAGRRDSAFFDQVYVRTNSLLNKYAPDAATKFVAAQERATAGDKESIAHALTWCRRMIKSLADVVYRATNEEKIGCDGISRKMTGRAYKDRLLQYVQEKVCEHNSNEVLTTIISDLDARLKALDALAGKGVHGDRSLDDVHSCVMQTYLLAADLLAIAGDTSVLLTNKEPPPPIRRHQRTDDFAHQQT